MPARSLRAKPGTSSISPANSRWPSTTSSMSVSATTVALRGAFSSNASSPNAAPGPISATLRPWRVTRQGRKIATIGPGAAFGELALLEKAPRNATVVADTDMELVVLGQREFAGLIDEVPGFARKLLAGMAHRLREADARSVQ